MLLTKDASMSTRKKRPHAKSAKPLTKEQRGRLCDIATIPRWMRVGFEHISRIEKTYMDRYIDGDNRVHEVQVTTVGIEIQHGKLEVGIFSDQEFDYHRGSPNSELLMRVLRDFALRNGPLSTQFRADIHEQRTADYVRLCGVAEREWGVIVQHPFISKDANQRGGK